MNDPWGDILLVFLAYSRKASLFRSNLKILFRVESEYSKNGLQIVLQQFWQTLRMVCFTKSQRSAHVTGDAYRRYVSQCFTRAVAAASRQSCPTLCNPIDGSQPGIPFLGFSRQEHWSGLPFPSPMHESEK